MQIIGFTAGALLAALPLAHATGKAIINSACDFDVYVWSVDSDTTTAKPTTLSSGGTYSEAYRSPTSGGVSLKMSNTTSDEGPITQFEYTLDGYIWYDLSNVNCQGDACPFQKYGLYLESGSGCPTVTCAGGELLCKGAYNNPDDNEDSLSCTSGSDVTVYLCQSDPSGSSSSSSAASSGYIGASTAYSSATAAASTISSSSSVPTPDYNQPSSTVGTVASSSADVISAAELASPSPTTLLTTAAPAAVTVYATVTASTTTTQWVNGVKPRDVSYHQHHGRNVGHAHHPRNFRA